MFSYLRLSAFILALTNLHKIHAQNDRPTLSLNGGTYGLTGGPTLIPPASTNRPGSLYDSGASYGLGQGVRPGGGFNGPPGGGGFNGPPGGGGFNGPQGGALPPFGSGGGYGIAGNRPRPGQGSSGRPPVGGFGGGVNGGGQGGPGFGGFNSDPSNFIEPFGGGGFTNRPPGAAPPVHELGEDGPYYRPHFRPPFGISGGYLPFPTKYGQGGTSGDVPFGGTGNFQGGGILPGGRPPQKFPNRPLIGGTHVGNLPPGVNNINNPKPLLGGSFGGGFGGNQHLSQSDRPGFVPSGPGGSPGSFPPYGSGASGQQPFGGSPSGPGQHTGGHTPVYENPYLKDPAIFTGGYDTCKCALSFNCNSPGIKFGKCDAGKQYCCYNSQVAGTNKHRPSSFFGNTALHQYYARPENHPSGGGLVRPVRGPGVLIGPGGPIDGTPPRAPSDPLVNPRKSSELPATNKLFPGEIR